MIADCRSRGLSGGTVRANVTAMKFLFGKLGIELTAQQRKDIGDDVLGAARANRSANRGKVPPVPEADIFKAADLAKEDGNLAGLRDSALLRLGYNALCRRSDLANLSVADLNPVHGTITFRHSKTDQTGKGATRRIGEPTINAILDYLRESGHKSGALFLGIRGSKARQRMTPDGIGKIIKRRMADIHRKRSSHVLRTSGATTLSTVHKCTVGQLQYAGRWETATTAIGYVTEAEDNPAELLC